MIVRWLFVACDDETNPHRHIGMLLNKFFGSNHSAGQGPFHISRSATKKQAMPDLRLKWKGCPITDITRWHDIRVDCKEHQWPLIAALSIKALNPSPFNLLDAEASTLQPIFQNGLCPTILRCDAGAADQLHCQRDRCMQAVFGCGLIHEYADNMPFLY